MRMTYREALRQGLHEALKKDDRVFLMGEDVGAYGGSYAVSKDFLKEFGPEKVRDTPLSELGFVGAGIGAALGGLRPIVEVMTVNFSLLAMDQIVNSAAMIRHMSGGQFTLPLVIRTTTGGGRQLAAQHSNSFEGWFAHIPGIKIIAPGTVTDARYMLGGALEDPNPVLIFEHALLLNQEEDCEDRSPDYSLYKAMVRRPGQGLSLITYGGMLVKCMTAAQTLATEGFDIEVIDLRSLRPLDEEAILSSVRKTHRVLIVDEGWRSGSLAAEISARIMEHAFYDLDAPVRRLCRKEVPIPYPKHLETAAIPQVNDIERTLREMLQ
ncbi:MAG: alpha-ketoacid dehydrogenase subunit beta [Pseudobdellovibrionaceae bacterium]